LSQFEAYQIGEASATFYQQNNKSKFTARQIRIYVSYISRWG